jgi:AcrR family transcriptional regulator
MPTIPETAQRSASFQLILETARQLIQEKGCRQTTLQHIIDRSGLSKGAIYHYVSGKDELFGLILKYGLESANERFDQVVAGTGQGDVKAPVQSIARSMVTQSARETVSNKIFTYLLSQIDNPKVAAIMHGVHEYTLQMSKRWIEVGQQAGAIPPDLDAGRVATLFMVFGFGLRVHHMTAPSDDSSKLGEDDVFQLMFRMLT